MSNEITFNTNLSELPRTRADFSYRIRPTLISITDTGLGSHSVFEDIEAVLRKIEYWHQGSITAFKIMCRDGKGFWHGVHWDSEDWRNQPRSGESRISRWKSLASHRWEVKRTATQLASPRALPSVMSSWLDHAKSSRWSRQYGG